MMRAIAQAQIDSLEQWAQAWDGDRDTSGTEEVAALMRRTVRQIRRVLDPLHAEPEPEHKPITAPEPRIDETADEATG